MEWEIAPLAIRGSRPAIPYCIPPKIGPLKYSKEYLVTCVVQWKPHQLRVIGILSHSPMITAIIPISGFAKQRMMP